MMRGKVSIPCAGAVFRDYCRDLSGAGYFRFVSIPCAGAVFRDFFA